MTGRIAPTTLKPEFKIELQAVVNRNYDGDTVVILTSSPDRDLDEWLSIHYGPAGLESFKFKAGRSGQADELISRDDPKLKIFIATYRLIRNDPRDILWIGKYRQARLARDR